MFPGPTLTPELARRYLAVLGVPKQKPSFETLREIVAAQLTHVPFENISKLYNRKRAGLVGLPSIQLFLDGIERFHFGGTCYSNNLHFYSLLRTLGYDAKLCAADMKDPGVHAVIIVTLDGREYLLDAGYAVPFLAPLPRDLPADHVIALGRDRYVLKPQDACGCSRLELYRHGELKHGYLVRPAACRIEDFRQVIANSFRPDATFLNSLLLARFYPNHAVMIHNLTLIESEGSQSTIRTLGNRDELVAKIEDEFGMPRSIVAEAVSELRALQDPWT